MKVVYQAGAYPGVKKEDVCREKTWPGAKSGRRHKIVYAGERLWRPYASHGAMRADDDEKVS